MKKTTMRVICITLVFALLCGFGVSALTTDTPAYNRKLQFGADGKFKILQISDIQDGPALLPITKDMIKEAIKETNPDLIVLTGDNITGGMCDTGMKFIDKQLVASAIDCFMSIFEDAGIPVAIIFGNHDAETTVSKEEQMEIYEKYDCFIGTDEGDSVYGVGNYNVPIYSSTDNTKIAYNLWMIDSGMYDYDENGDSNGYDYVHQDQIDWYINTSNELKAQNGGQLVPSMMFQHIIVRDVFDYLLKTTEDTAGAVGYEGNYYILDPEITRAGTLHEHPCPSKTNSGEFDAVVAQGDVVAMFFGHDHVNNFEIETPEGVDLVATAGATFLSYGDENRGCREIVLDESDLWSYQTRSITYNDMYGDDELAQLRLKTFGSEYSFMERMTAGTKYFYLKYFKGLLQTVDKIANG